MTSWEPESCQIHVDEDRPAKLGLTLQDLARFLEAEPYFFAVFTQDEVARAAGKASAVPARDQVK